MVSIIEKELGMLILKILDNTLERDISQISIELHSNLGEVKTYEFSNVEQAVEFLNTSELKDVFISSDSLTLFDTPSHSDEDEN